MMAGVLCLQAFPVDLPLRSADASWHLTIRKSDLVEIRSALVRRKGFPLHLLQPGCQVLLHRGSTEGRVHVRLPPDELRAAKVPAAAAPAADAAAAAAADAVAQGRSRPSGSGAAGGTERGRPAAASRAAQRAERAAAAVRTGGDTAADAVDDGLQPQVKQDGVCSGASLKLRGWFGTRITCLKSYVVT